MNIREAKSVLKQAGYQVSKPETWSVKTAVVRVNAQSFSDQWNEARLARYLERHLEGLSLKQFQTEIAPINALRKIEVVQGRGRH